MNILFLNWRDRQNPKAGGAEVITEALMTELAKQGHHLTLFSASFPGAPQTEQAGGYRIIRSGSPFSVHYQAWRWWRSVGCREQFDVVVDQFHGVPFFTPLYQQPDRLLCLIHEVPGPLWLKIAKFPANFLLMLVEPLVFLPYRRVHFLAVSNSTRLDLQRRGIKPTHISLLPEAIDTEPLNVLPKKEPTHQLVFVGRHHPMKRIDHLLHMMQILPDSYTLQLIGRGDPAYIKYLRSLARALKVHPRVNFHGSVPLAERNRSLEQASLLVSASYKEGWGLIVTEANALGTPAATYNVGGYRDSIDNGQTGWLAEHNSPAGLAETVIQAMSDPDRYQTIRTAAWQSSKQYTIARTAKAFLVAIPKHEAHHA